MTLTLSLAALLARLSHFTDTEAVAVQPRVLPPVSCPVESLRPGEGTPDDPGRREWVPQSYQD